MSRLITASEVIEIAFPNYKFDTARIKDAVIEVAELQHIKPALTKDLYKKLVTGNITGKYATLLNEYIKKALAYFVKYECLPDVIIDLANAGAFQNNSEFASAAPDRMLGDLREATLVQARVLMDNAMEYIEDNEDDFPEYKEEDDPNKTTTIIGGLVLGNTDDEETSYD